MLPFLKKIKDALLTIRFSILTIFVSFFVLAITSLITITYFRFSSAISDTALQLMERSSTDIFYRIGLQFLRIESHLKFIKRMIETGVMNPNDTKLMFQYLYA